MAADILFVADHDNDTTIADVLEADGHSVTRIVNNFSAGGTPALQADLSAYDAVYWVANGAGFGSTHNAATTDAVDAYALAGGYVFVTGYDSIASPDDPNLWALIGAAESRDVPGAPAAIIDAYNVLTAGVTDLRGVVPTGANGDRDAAQDLLPGTIPVSGTMDEAQWTLRPVGSGYVAYVSAGRNGSGSDPAWSAASGAYNGAIRNFAFNATPGPSNVLFVSDSGVDPGIVGVLEADGHTVTAELDVFDGGVTAPLEGDLSGYGVIIWSASGGGFGSTHNASTTEAVAAWVGAGGHLFITGYDSMDSPDDPNLRALAGCSSGRDVPAAVGVITDTETSLNTGLFDLRGVTPTGLSSDRDALSSCGPEVVPVAATGTSATEFQWTVRSLGMGEVAYLANGDSGTSGTHPSWTTASNAAHRAVRNFAFNGRRIGVTYNTDSDGDGFNDDEDCAPDNPDINPDALEVCDGEDNDCDPMTVDGFDEATFGEACDGDDTDLCLEGTIACAAGVLACSDETSNDVDVCDGADNDCNPATMDGSGDPDVGGACDGPDADLCAEGILSCSGGMLSCSDVSDDNVELCDGEDNDCNGMTADGADEATLGDLCDGEDSDLCAEGAIACTGGALACSDVTDDTLDVCDGEDNDCNPGTADGADEPTLGDDCDGDDSDLCEEGAVVCDAGALGCDDETGDDVEVCDGADNDCDGLTDDDDDDIAGSDPSGTGATVWYLDDDEDLCGDAASPLYVCADGMPEGYVANALDLDDGDGFCCGNGYVDGDEVCDGDDLGDLPATCGEYDGGYVDGTIACAATCDMPDESACVDNVCGDGVTAGDEACDDGNTDADDGCDATCAIEPGWSCDGLAGATSDCAETCGDGVVDPYELCDDANIDAGDGCSPSCLVEDGWTCEVEDDVTACTPECGDGRTLGDERCDDGNTDADDGCGPTCEPEPGFVCIVTDEVSVCAETCGDGVVDTGEACDDGNLDADDGCDATCRLETGWFCGDADCEPVCGDGLLRGTELDEGGCDDGNRDGGDGCDAVCMVEENYLCTGEPSTCSLQAFCGDGTVDDGEACDDGNSDDGDGCSAMCATEDGWICDDDAPTVCLPDTDGDGIDDDADNCPDDANDDQADLDSDDIGDACDDDRDGDGVANDDDACPDEFGEGDDGCAPTGGDTGADAGTDAGTDAGGTDTGGMDAGMDATADGSGIDSGEGGGGTSSGSGSGGCAAAPTSGGGAAGLGLLALLGLVVTRRRRR